VLFLLAIVLSVLLRFTDSDCLFGILDLRILIAPLVSSNSYYGNKKIGIWTESLLLKVQILTSWSRQNLSLRDGRFASQIYQIPLENSGDEAAPPFPNNRNKYCCLPFPLQLVYKQQNLMLKSLQ